jgi:hypothetical protein
MAAQILTVALQILAGCIWLLILAGASSANEVAAKRGSSTPDDACEPREMPATPQPAHS